MTAATSRLLRAREALSKGGVVILVDDENRENEGDFICAGELITPEAVNFMITHGRGLLCLAMAPDHADRLNLEPMARENQSPYATAFTVSIEAKTGVTTGISVSDRARTIQVASNPLSTRDDLRTPGHIFPLRAREGGVSARRGHTEGSVELVRSTGLAPTSAICEILNADGTMARLPDLELIAAAHNLPIVFIEDLVRELASLDSREKSCDAVHV